MYKGNVTDFCIKAVEYANRAYPHHRFRIYFQSSKEYKERFFLRIDFVGGGNSGKGFEYFYNTPDLEKVIYDIINEFLKTIHNV